jgi:hypothetical protein
MSSLNLRRIARPEILRSVSFEHLVDLLNSEAETFLVDEVELDLDADEKDFDFDALAAVLADPPETFPPPSPTRSTTSTRWRTRTAWSCCSTPARSPRSRR